LLPNQVIPNLRLVTGANQINHVLSNLTRGRGAICHWSGEAQRAG
jgi:hypothetical protein